MTLTPDDWLAVFAPGAPMLELVARGSVLYLGVLLILRLIPRRSGGELATMDLIFIVLIADAAAGALGEYESLADAFVVIATLVAWDYLINVLSYRFPVIERLVSAPPLPIVRDGEMLRRNMRREFITEEELMSHLRLKGIDDVGDVKIAYVEGEGKITAVRRGE